MDGGPQALAVFAPGQSAYQRFLARLGTSGAVSVGVGTRPVPLKGLVSVCLGAVGGMMLAQPFDRRHLPGPPLRPGRRDGRRRHRVGGRPSSATRHHRGR